MTGATEIKSSSLLPRCRVVLGFRRALLFPASSQSLREHLACPLLLPAAPVFDQPRLGPSGIGPGARPPSGLLRNPPPSHCRSRCAHLLGAKSSEGLQSPRPAPSFAFNGSALRLILFSSGFFLRDESRVGLKDQEVPLASPSWVRPTLKGLPLPSPGRKEAAARAQPLPEGGLPPPGFGSKASRTPPPAHPSLDFCPRPFKASAIPHPSPPTPGAPSVWGPIAPSDAGRKETKYFLTKCHFFQKRAFVNIRRRKVGFFTRGRKQEGTE